MNGEAVRLVVLGAGGEVPNYLDALELRERRGGPPFEVVALLDDNPLLHGREVYGHTVAGPLSRVAEWPAASLLWGMGSVNRPTVRLEVAHRLSLPARRFHTLVHPDAVVSARAFVSSGVTIQAGSQVCAGVRLHPHVSLGVSCLVQHDCVIGPGVLFAGGCLVAGAVRIGPGAYLGQGCNLRDRLRLGACAVVGMGAVVLQDVGEGETVVGNPARVLRKTPLPGDLGIWSEFASFTESS